MCLTFLRIIMFFCSEHLNIVLFELARQYHSSLSKVDVASCTSVAAGSTGDGATSNRNPLCDHKLPSKLVQVRKEGANKVRRENNVLFYLSDFTGIINVLT